MKNSIRLIAALLMASLLSGCEANEVERAMVRFDRAFIPVLVHTYEGDIYQAKRSVFYLEFQWQKLRNHYKGYLPEEEATLQRINGWLGDAYYAIDANCPFTAANQLEHVKYEFMELRRRYGITYYLDGLYSFQGQLGLLTEAANDEMLCLMEWGEYEALLEEVQREWESLKDKPVDARLFELDEEHLQQLKARQNTLSLTLKQLKNKIGSGNRLEVAKASKALQPAFFNVLRPFGQFEASQTYFAQKHADAENHW